MSSPRFEVQHSILGIDPGKDGGAVLLTPSKCLVFPWEPNWSALFDAVSLYDPVCFIEKVSASGQMGVKSAFSFGGNFYAWGVVLKIFEIPTVQVMPAEWQVSLGLSKGISYAERKTLLYKASSVRFEKHTKRMADAFLIADYGHSNYGQFFNDSEPGYARNQKRVSVGFSP